MTSLCWPDTWSMLDLDSKLLHQRVSSPKRKHTFWLLYSWDQLNDVLCCMMLKIFMKKNIHLYTRDCICVRLCGVCLCVHVHMSAHVCMCHSCELCALSLTEAGPQGLARLVGWPSNARVSTHSSTRLTGTSPTRVLEIRPSPCTAEWTPPPQPEPSLQPRCVSLCFGV